MIENRRGLTIFSHTMLILGIAVILFPLYVAFVAATLDDRAVFETPMTLLPGTQLLENIISKLFGSTASVLIARHSG